MDVKISLTDTDDLDAAFDLHAKSETQKRSAYVAFSQLAVGLCTDWLAGRARFRSLTELQLELVQRIYDALLPEEAPSVDRLFNKFNLPHGQASYMARVLSEKSVPRWRSVAARELRACVDKLATQHTQTTKADAKDTYAQDEISAAAYRELMTICNQLKRSEPTTFAMPESAGSVGDFRRVKLLVTTLRRVQSHMASEQLGEG